MLLALGIGVGATAVYASKNYRKNQKTTKKKILETPKGVKEEASDNDRALSKSDKQME